MPDLWIESHKTAEAIEHSAASEGGKSTARPSREQDLLPLPSWFSSLCQQNLLYLFIYTLPEWSALAHRGIRWAPQPHLTLLITRVMWRRERVSEDRGTASPPSGMFEMFPHPSTLPWTTLILKVEENLWQFAPFFHGPCSWPFFDIHVNDFITWPWAACVLKFSIQTATLKC